MDKTMQYQGVTANVICESRGIGAVYRNQAWEFDERTAEVEVPARLSKAWMTEICDRLNVDRFEVVTRRRIAWSPKWEMCRRMATWERTQFVVRGPAGIGVTHSKIRALDREG